MAGRYPFLEPSRCHNRADAEQRISDIIDAGITTFICLQEEIPPQAEIKRTGHMGFMPYKTVAELVSASRRPPPPVEIMEGLRNPSVNKFLPAKHKQDREIVQRYGKDNEVEFLYYPIVDLGLPDDDVLDGVVGAIEERLLTGEHGVYVHCWGGRGRAGTVAACVLGRVYGVGADEALERVQRAYDTRGEGRKSPETEAQVAFVKKWIGAKG